MKVGLKERDTMARWLAAVLCVMMLSVPLGTARAAETLPSGLADAELAAAVDAFVEANRDTTAAVSVAVTRGQQVLLERAYGYADIAAGRAADADTVYEWGSVTKLLVWTSVMQLVEQGRLDLQADLTTYLPEGFLTKLRYDAPLNMMNLMHHNAGWEDVLIGIFVDPASATGNLEQALRSSEPNQIYEPGTVCAYSNWGVALAGLIVERVSGQSFADYVQEHIFAPLGMRHTAVSPRLEDNPWVLERRVLSQGYYSGLQAIPNQYAIPLYPAGMATGTLGDFLRFAQALLPGAGMPSPLFEQPGTLSAMLTPTLMYGDGSPRNCHGFWALDFGVPVIGHGGNTAGFSSYLLLHPESGTGVVVMTNQTNETVYNEGLPKLVFGGFEPVEAAGDLPDARDLQGLYRSGRITLHGCAKLYGVLNLLPIFGGDEDTLKASFMGESLVLKQRTPDFFMMEEKPDAVPIESLRAERTEDGGARLAMPYFEFMRIPTSVGIGWMASLLALALALAYCAVALVGGGTRRLILRLRHRRGETSCLRKYHLLLCGMGLVEGLNIVWLAVHLMTYSSKVWIGVNIGLFWLCAAAAAAYLALLALKLKKAPCNGKEKALYVVTGIVSLVMLLNIAVWQLYRF